ncbi:MAG: response regulator transcription factor [Caldilineaceae bacterium]
MPISIFLADDHGVLRAGLRLLLEAQPDFKVVGEATDGREAVRKVSQLAPDVVVLDIGMPELNGIEATRQICEKCPKTQIVILSMHAASEHIFQALQAGARGYVMKAAVSEELILAIRAVHRGERHLSRKVADELISDYLAQRTRSEQANPLLQLNTHEREIIQLVAEGKSSAAIAEMLALSTKTVETYRCRVMQKLNLSDLPSLVKFAIQNGLTSLL